MFQNVITFIENNVCSKQHRDKKEKGKENPELSQATFMSLFGQKL